MRPRTSHPEHRPIGAARSGTALLAGLLSIALIPGQAGAAQPQAQPAPPPDAGAANASAESPFGEVQLWEPPKVVNRTPTGKRPTSKWKFPTSGKPGQAPAEPEPEAASPGVGRFGNTALSRLLAPNPATPADDAVAKPGLGVQGHYRMEQFGLTESMTAAVNVGNGNLVVRSADVAINGPGLGLALDRFYNGLSGRTGALGPQWSVSAGQDVGLEVGTGSVVFRAPSGFRATFTANSDGTYTAPPGLNADLTRAVDGTYTVIYQSAGEKLTFTAGGYLTSDADRNGNALRYLYNPDDTVASVTDAAGRVTTFQYDQGRIRQITDPAARATRYEYVNNRLAAVFNPNGGATRYAYDTAGRLTRLETPDQKITTVGYDTANRVSRISRHLARFDDTSPAATTTFSYADGSTTQTDPRGNATRYTLDTAGRVTTTTDPLGRQRSGTYTPNSAIATATDAMGTGTTAGNVSSYSYDTANNPTAVQAPTGAAARAVYTAGGTCGSTDTTHRYSAKCTTDPQGNQTSFDYDTAGNLLASKGTTSSTGAVTVSTSYQGTNGASCGGKTGQVCSVTNGNGAVTSYRYDTDGNPTTVTQPAPLGPTTLTYDSIGRLTSSTDGKNQRTEFGYDSMDRLTKQIFAGGSDLSTFYDNDGNRTGETDAGQGAGSTSYTYDALNRQIAVRPPNVASDLTVTLDLAGNTTSSADPAGTTTYGYNTASELVALAEPGFSCPATGDAAGCTRFSYDSNGTLASTRYPGGTTQNHTVDESGRATRITARNAAGTVLSDLSYSYAAPGGTGPEADRDLVQSRTDHLGVGGPAGSTTNYKYDTLNRLTAATETTTAGATNAAWSYSYDNAGNRTSQTRAGDTGATAGTTSYGYNAADQLITRNGSAAGFSYDANGNELGSPGDPEVGGPARNEAYTSRDQLASLAAANVTTSFTYTGATNDSRLTAGPTGFQHSMLGLTGITGDRSGSYIRTPAAELISQRVAGASQYYLTDNLGSVVALVDSTGTKTAAYAYDPYGVARVVTGSAAATNPFRYTGGHHEQGSGLYKFGVRYYDPAVGRFTQPDPSSQDPHYTYAGNDPISNIDPEGDAFFVPLLILGGRLAAPHLARAGAAGGRAALAAGRSAISRSGVKWKGGELSFGKNVRVSPFGNAKMEKGGGRYPHYHRRGVARDGSTIPGQGIGRHRPWDRKSTDTRLRDRF